MKVLKWLLWTVLALAAVLLTGGLMLSPKFSVSRSTVVQAPADKVYALVASPRQWKAWSVWNRRDPSMQIDYSGPDSGAGAVWAWKSRSEGDGRMSFTAAEPNRRVVYELYFPDFGTTSTGAFAFVPEPGGGTRVTWSIEGDFGRNPLARWFALLADNMVRRDFEGGLANLKALAEQRG
jgi:uncharacterized protein YndB with AHSA1/START domain